LETIISARIAQKMTKVKFDKEKEVLGLALANIGCGILG
jgi:MFS superfamily sulfate permease-like transporter